MMLLSECILLANEVSKWLNENGDCRKPAVEETIHALNDMGYLREEPMPRDTTDEQKAAMTEDIHGGWGPDAMKEAIGRPENRSREIVVIQYADGSPADRAKAIQTGAALREAGFTGIGLIAPDCLKIYSLSGNMFIAESPESVEPDEIEEFFRDGISPPIPENIREALKQKVHPTGLPATLYGIPVIAEDTKALGTSISTDHRRNANASARHTHEH